jgi:hypothetical protein
MRRALSILLILFFGLGPFAAALSASDESSVPACCRRHGAHRCTMSAPTAAMLLEAASGQHLLTAPASCPYFPGYTVAPNTSVLALAAAPAGLPVLLSAPHSPAASRADARVSQVCTRVGRGPPASPLA